MDKKEAFKIVLDDLLEYNLFKGKYDAEHGSDKFMSGIYTVMTVIANTVSEDVGDKYTIMFFDNIEKSEREAKRKIDEELLKLFKKF